MNRALIQCVVESLRVTGPLEESLARLKPFSERDWQRVLTWLDESGLGLYLLKQLRDSNSLDALPAEIRTQLQQNLATNRRRLSIMKEEFDSLNRHFTAAGVDYVVLKGFALIPEFCPDAVLRSQYDYDFLVHRESASAARQVLEARGYSLKTKNPGFEKEDESHFTAQALTIPSSDQNFYSPNIPRAVELHLGLWEPIRDMIKVGTPKDALNRKRLSNWESLRFPVLAEDDSLIFQVLHAFQHLLSYWCRPSCFLEIAHFLARRQGDMEFWERFRLRVDGHRSLPQMVGLVFSMAEILFHAPLPPEVTAWTTRTLPPTLSFWVKRHGREWALARFPGSKLSLFVHRAFIEDPEIWKEIERSRLFPFHRAPKVVEPRDQGHASHWRARWDQGRFVWSRLKFHVGGLLTYFMELPAWKKNLQQVERIENRHRARQGLKPA
ncbi:MAG: nucleotidyltransferase family protein [Terriglobia bacterium]|jgi:hypothetical protein